MTVAHPDPTRRAIGRAAQQRGKREQQAVVSLFRAAGLRVWELSQPRATMQSPGLPDLILTAPELHWAAVWETKAPGAVLTKPQALFRTHVEAAAVSHYAGGVADAWRLLHTLRLAIPKPLDANGYRLTERTIALRRARAAEAADLHSHRRRRRHGGV